eukprot:12442904-Alexandrium_andersonii.AAC.1
MSLQSLGRLSVRGSSCWPRKVPSGMGAVVDGLFKRACSPTLTWTRPAQRASLNCRSPCDRAQPPP